MRGHARAIDGELWANQQVKSHRRQLAGAERLAGVEERMSTKENLANLRTEIVSSEERIILWVVGVFILSQLLPDFLQRMGIV